MVGWYEDFIPPYKRDVTKIVDLSDDYVYIYEPGREKHEGGFYYLEGKQFGLVAERDYKCIYGHIFLANWHRNNWDYDFEIPVDENQILAAWEILITTEMIWVATGKTYEHKDELREFGMQWDANSQLWHSDELPQYNHPNIKFRHVPADILNITWI